MWYVIQDGEMIPLGVVNARAACEKALSGHDTTHGGGEYPFCEDYGCQEIVRIQDALDAEPVKE